MPLFGVVDVNQAKVVDVITNVPDQYQQELTELYHRLTGETSVSFSSTDEAKVKVIEAVQRVYLRGEKSPLSTGGVVGPPKDEHHDVEKIGPVKLCRIVFEEMRGARRKDMIEACVRLGVNKATAQTQYQRYKMALQIAEEREELMKKGSSVEGPRSPEGMPQLPPGVSADHASQ